MSVGNEGGVLGKGDGREGEGYRAGRYWAGRYGESQGGGISLVCDSR